jgi:heme/copper-type cytochrome/quinol oxidase subunit 2
MISVKARRLGQFAVALLAIGLALAFAQPALPRPAEDGARVERLVRIEASQYQFDPGVVRVKRGELVTIELVASDVVHGLYLDGYGLEMSADPGQTERLTFVADRPGTFRFRCSVTCGAMHPFMVGKLQVGDNRILWGGAGLALLAAVAGLVLGRKER